MRLRLMPIFALAVVTFGGAAGASDVTESSPLYHVPRIENVVIDGSPDDWGASEGFHIDFLMPSGGALQPVEDALLEIRLGWNDEGLLLLASLRDDVWLEHEELAHLWDCDSMEMAMAVRCGAPDICKWAIAPGMDTTHPEMRWRLDDNRSDEALKDAPAQLTVARTKTDAGCTIEVLMPWTALAIRPEKGREIAFQVGHTDVDEPDGPQYYTLWLPGAAGGGDSSGYHRLSLGDEASPAISAYATGSYDMDRLKACVRVTATGDKRGRTVSAAGWGRTPSEAVLAGDISGHATADVLIPMPPKGESTAPLSVAIEGEIFRTLRLPDADRERAKAFCRRTLGARPCVFSGETLPELRFDRPVWIERLIGPYTLKTVYYDKDCNVVEKAEKPGRYGAVVRIETSDGLVQSRFLTLFRTPGELDLWDNPLKVQLELPRAAGVSPEALRAHSGDVDDFLSRRISDSFYREGCSAAVFLAGLHEAEQREAEDDFYESALQKDRRWWLGFKRKTYLLESRYPDRFVCPRPVEGRPATVLGEGTLEEAGMKPDAAEKIDSLLTEWAADSNEAFAVCIARRCVIVHHKAYGTRDGKPMTLETKSWMASITKVLSGTCLMMLVDQGKIDLDDPVSKYLPPFQNVNTNAPLTIRHLYTHTSGLTWHWGCDINDMEERIAGLAPHLEVGARYGYNGTGIELAQKIVEAVTGETLPDFYRKHLFKPLGCRNTEAASASWDTQSVPLDMARIAQMLLNRGAYGDMRFFSEKTFEEMLPQRLTKVLGPDTSAVYGIGTGWRKNDGLGEGAFGHGAASNATFCVDPEHDLVIIMTRDDAGENFRKYDRRFVRTIVDGLADATGEKTPK